MMTPTYAEIIMGVRSKLNCGRDRIADSPTGFRWTFWPSTPTFETQLLSDYGVPSKEPELESSFRAEVAAIRDTLEELGCKPKLENWQRGGSEAGQRLRGSMNLAADALALWDEIGVPLRCKHNVVYRILAPCDVLGSPVIDAVPIDVYVREVCEQSAKDVVEKALVQRCVKRWRVGVIICAVILAVVLIMVYS